MVHRMAGITKLLGIAIADADAGRIPRDRVEAKRDRIVHLWTRTASLFDGRLGRIKQQRLNALIRHAAEHDR